ncbi:hypothetical protein [Pseudopedobacter beijingensis]|uniref:Uncharacterized protein n=1 Tax=Pseudopedobacter beijingensis TaxID=1207056 RepID=A0ABW4IHX0_9SPHI
MNKFSRKAITLVAMFGSITGSALAQSAKPFKKDNLVIYRIGDMHSGSDINTYNACPIYLDEYNVSGEKPVLVQSIGLPTKTIGENKRIVAVGKEVWSGWISLSNDGQHIVVPGYDASLGTEIANKPAESVNRVAALVGVDGSVNSSFVLSNAFNNSAFRSVATIDGSEIWAAGGGGINNGGIFYLKKGEQQGVNIGGATFMQIKYVDGDLLACEKARIYKIGSGKVTEAPKKFTNLTGDPIFTDATSFAFVNVDKTGNNPQKVLYLLSYNNGVAKYSMVKNKWELNGIYKDESITKGNAIEGKLVDGKIKLYVISTGNTRGGDGKLIEIIDNAGHGQDIDGSSKLLLKSAENQTFRSLSWAPVKK